MRVPLSWLQDFIDLPTTDIGELKYALDMLGLQVEGVETFEADWTEVYVGKVLEIAPHPDADKIRVCQVDSGEGPVQIICGAWNFEDGATVAVARPGAVLPGDFEIGQRNIRGVESNGMICSERELGLGDDHEGILVLDDSFEVGRPFSECVELPDYVFELDVAPNRPDALSLVGVARDLAAYFKVDFTIPVVPMNAVEGQTPIQVEIADPTGCRRFTAREIAGVQIAKSPFPIRHRLHKVGVRAISNVVDVTNYVMFELGHPLHAFDAGTIDGDRLVVKRAEEGETLVTLDDIERDLSSDDLIIYDASGPTSMSGTMGGARSEVSESTSRVLMEAASWDPPTIMHMWRRHDLRSEAATRFERGVDPNLADVANQRASAMVAKLAGGEVLSGAVDEVAVPTEPIAVELSIAEVERILGPGFTIEGVTEVLERIGFAVEGDDPMSVTIPTYRPDSYRPIDVIEEIARIHGYDKFEATLPIGPTGGLTTEQRRTRLIRQTLTGFGLHHAVSLPFVDPGWLELFEVSSEVLLTVKNPLREQESKLRPTLLPGLLNAVRYNQSHGIRSVALFELGNTFGVDPDIDDGRLPTQKERLSWVAVGDFGADVMGSEKKTADGEYSLALVRQLAAALDVSLELTPVAAPGFHPGRTAEVSIGGERVGLVGELAPAVNRAFGIEGRVAVAELDVSRLVADAEFVQSTSPSVFPHVDFDLSFLVDRTALAGELLDVTSEAAGELLESADVFDVYLGEGVQPDKKAIAIAYRLRATDRTLEQEEIGSVRQAMIDAASQQGAELRGA